MGEVEKQKLKGSLGVAPIVMMVVATAAPLTVMVANTPKTLLAPIGGLIGILGCLWVAVSNLPDLIGGDNAKTVSLFVVLFLVATFAFGVWIAEHFRARHPTRYETLRQLA